MHASTSRRAVVTGMAWAVPVVVTASALPAFAASAGSPCAAVQNYVNGLKAGGVDGRQRQLGTISTRPGPTEYDTIVEITLTEPLPYPYKFQVRVDTDTSYGISSQSGGVYDGTYFTVKANTGSLVASFKVSRNMAVPLGPVDITMVPVGFVFPAGCDLNGQLVQDDLFREA